MSTSCIHGPFVSPIVVDDIENESNVQGGEMPQPLGQEGLPENLDVESVDSSDDDDNEAVPVTS